MVEQPVVAVHMVVPQSMEMQLPMTQARHPWPRTLPCTTHRVSGEATKMMTMAKTSL